jgi:hypothetical protein
MVTANVQVLEPAVPAELTKEIPQDGVGVLVAMVPVGVQMTLEQLEVPTPKCWWKTKPWPTVLSQKEHGELPVIPHSYNRLTPEQAPRNVGQEPQKFPTALFIPT